MLLIIRSRSNIRCRRFPVQFSGRTRAFFKYIQIGYIQILFDQTYATLGERIALFEILGFLATISTASSCLLLVACVWVSVLGVLISVARCLSTSATRAASAASGGAKYVHFARRSRRIRCRFGYDVFERLLVDFQVLSSAYYVRVFAQFVQPLGCY